MKNIKSQELISQGWDNNWLKYNDMETAEERAVFEQLMSRNELNIYCDTLVSVDTQSIRQDLLQWTLRVNDEFAQWKKAHQRKGDELNDSIFLGCGEW